MTLHCALGINGALQWIGSEARWIAELLFSGDLHSGWIRQVPSIGSYSMECTWHHLLQQVHVLGYLFRGEKLTASPFVIVVAATNMIAYHHGHRHHPGNAGNSAETAQRAWDGGCCWGAWGAGGSPGTHCVILFIWVKDIQMLKCTIICEKQVLSSGYMPFQSI